MKTARGTGTALDVSTRLWHHGDVAMGPAKADLLDAIAATGSISNAGRATNVSARRAAQLVDLMNRNFAKPLVHSTTGSARLTDMGLLVLSRYRAMQAALDATAARHADGLADLLLRSPQPAPAEPTQICTGSADSI